MITDADIKKLKTVFASRDDLVNFKDAILHEIQNLRDDITVTTGYRDTLEDHEDRLEVIETKLQLTS